MAQSANKATATKKKSTTSKKVDKEPKPKAKAKTGASAAKENPNTTAKANREKANGANAARPEKQGSKRGTRNRGGRNYKSGPARSPLKSRSYPIVRETLQIDHAITQGSYDRCFDSFRSSFFHTTSILGRCGIPEGADQVNSYIMDLIDNARAQMENETFRIGEMIREATGQKSIPKSAPNVQQRTAEIPSFLVRKYLTLFPVADRLIDAIVYAEIAGTLPWKRRAELLNLVKKYLRSPWGRYHSNRAEAD